MRDTYRGQIYLGELAEGGTRLKPPRRLTNDEASDIPSAWTADSQAVLFDSDRNGTDGIFKQRITQDTPEPVVTGALPQLSADGAWILFVERPGKTANPAPPERLMRIPANGGAPQFVLETRNRRDFKCARAPATLCVILETSQDEKQLTITAFDPLKGRGKVLRTIETPYHRAGALSPDGSAFAIVDGESEIRIRLLSLLGGPDSEIMVKGWPYVSLLDWAPSEKGFYYGSRSSQGGTLLYVDLKGNARVLYQFKGLGGSVRGIPSPDGRYVAISGGGLDGNVWMLAGF